MAYFPNPILMNREATKALSRGFSEGFSASGGLEAVLPVPAWALDSRLGAPSP